MDQEQILKELNYAAVKSSGAGGQHVNKTASKVELQFNVEQSHGIQEEVKIRILKNLKSRLSKENVLVLQSGESRSQHKNKVLVTQRLFEMLERAAKKPKVRKRTKPTRASKMKRLKKKKMKAEKKANRRDPLK
ncbi:alternative ribosome rescue aminoacyl-tRNA hydrolase ArfB [Zunongwangia sp. H14]|uniref:alternative ribosome rescue aminoacyl-tRNA hydrolase ArfB n=1 Tax=Zunongwangia sp. H14 TaxID=3240792 RepID=UPI003565AEDD